MKIEIYVATHKAYEFPNLKEYLPIHVGKAGSSLDLGIIGDNTGDNISNLNSSFCELTALYWMWKNSQADILGLAHYRRYFINQQQQFLCSLDLNDFSAKEVIVAKKRQFFKVTKILGIRVSKKVLSVEEHYFKDHYSSDWQKIRSLIADISPDYLTAFDAVAVNKQGISLYNMIIAHKKILDEYCEWIFKILFAFKEQTDITTYDAYQRRIYGFISERLLNVFLFKKQNELNIKYFDIVMK